MIGDLLKNKVRYNGFYSYNDIDHKKEIFSVLYGLGKDSVMVIHGGGIYGDKESAIQRWSDNYKNLPPSVKKRLVLENCEKCYSIEDCLKINELCGVPIVMKK